MISSRLGVLALLALTLSTTYVRSQAPDSGQATVVTTSHRFTKLNDGVYFATGTGNVTLISNALIVIGRDNVLIADSHASGAAGEALIASVTQLTNKPIRYVVSSHYHYDHTYGNQAFGANVDIIGHEYTRVQLHDSVMNADVVKRYTEQSRATVAGLEGRLATATGDERKTIESQLVVERAHGQALTEIVLTPPNITMKDSMSLYQGDREIRLQFLGRAHTAGDIVIYLPRERVVYTGDMMQPGMAFMGSSYVDEWPATLEALKALEFDVMLPGHGAAMYGKDRIGHFQSYLRDLRQRVGDAKSKGRTAAQAAAEVDMRDHRSNYPQLARVGVGVDTVNRIYDLIDQRVK